MKGLFDELSVDYRMFQTCSSANYFSEGMF